MYFHFVENCSEERKNQQAHGHFITSSRVWLIYYTSVSEIKEQYDILDKNLVFLNNGLAILKKWPVRVLWI
jgi:hypothetical protein